MKNFKNTGTQFICTNCNINICPCSIKENKTLTFTPLNLEQVRSLILNNECRHYTLKFKSNTEFVNTTYIFQKIR
jgi:hypothetical protein